MSSLDFDSIPLTHARVFVFPFHFSCHFDLISPDSRIQVLFVCVLVSFVLIMFVLESGFSHNFVFIFNLITVIFFFTFPLLLNHY